MVKQISLLHISMLFRTVNDVSEVSQYVCMYEWLYIANLKVIGSSYLLLCYKLVFPNFYLITDLFKNITMNNHHRYNLLWRSKKAIIAGITKYYILSQFNKDSILAIHWNHKRITIIFGISLTYTIGRRFT